MISDKRKTVRGGEIRQIKSIFVAEAIDRAQQSGFQQPFISQPFAPAKPGNAGIVEMEDGRLLQPNRLVHFARAANVSRYRSMNDSPASIWA